MKCRTEVGLFGANIPLSTLFSNILSLCPPLSIRDHHPHPYRTTGKFLILTLYWMQVGFALYKLTMSAKVSTLLYLLSRRCPFHVILMACMNGMWACAVVMYTKAWPLCIAPNPSIPSALVHRTQALFSAARSGPEWDVLLFHSGLRCCNKTLRLAPAMTATRDFILSRISLPSAHNQTTQ
jgi:hypothetical protein